jgi:hypothetical protein
MEQVLAAGDKRAARAKAVAVAKTAAGRIRPVAPAETAVALQAKAPTAAEVKPNEAPKHSVGSNPNNETK